jgi:hypothetical protein
MERWHAKGLGTSKIQSGNISIAKVMNWEMMPKKVRKVRHEEQLQVL